MGHRDPISLSQLTTNVDISGIFGLSRNVPEFFTGLNPYICAPSNLRINFGNTFLKPTIFTQEFKLLPDLREVHLNLYHQLVGPTEHTCAFVTEWPFWLQGCPQLSTVVVAIPKRVPTWHRSHHGNLLIRKLLKAVVKRVSNKLGVQGVDVSEKCSGNFGLYCEIWQWEAEEGTFMDWTQELGWSASFEEKLRHYNFFDDKSEGNLKFLGGTFVLRKFEHWPKFDSSW